MNNNFVFLPVFLLSLLVAFPAVANNNKTKDQVVNSDIPSLNEIQLPATNANLLTQQPAETEVKKNTETDLSPTEPTEDTDISIEAIGEKDALPESTPTHVIEKEE
ncbi:MAG: TonB-dependent receptor, partial [Sphaerospermopsis kisseleviana]